MARYRSFGQLDDPYVEDGDLGFTGLDMHTSPTLLGAGMLQLAENIRIDEGVISSRKGMTKVFNTNRGHALKLFSDPDGNEQLIIINRYSLYNSLGELVSNYGAGLIYDVGEQVIPVQAFEKLYLFAEGRRPREWSGVTGENTVEFSSVPAHDEVNFVCPNAGFGNYMANRLVVPKADDSSTTVAFSEIFEPNHFKIVNTYFCNKGTNDKTLAIIPYAENQALVLNNKSIHIINGTHFLGESSTNFEITRQYGVAGSKAYVQNGSYIYFISNEGNIQVLVPSSDPAKGLGLAISKVTLDQEPLSKPVTPVINRINASALDKSVVHYHKNKVYFAIPIDGASQPNAILVYDSLLSTFISLDTFSNSGQWIIDMESWGDDMYLLTNQALYKYEDSDSQQDDTYNFVTKFKTRNYLLGSRGIKNFKSGSISYTVTNGTRLKVDANTVDPDQSTTVKEEVFSTTGDAIARFNLRKRGYSTSIEVTSEYQPAKYKSVHLEASYTSNTVGDFE
jgi:hypothetical protein